MAIEQELEKLHENLKALGSAREKLNIVSGNLAETTGAIVQAGESLKRLADMPQLTERVQTSVDRMINASKDVEILNAVMSVTSVVQSIAADIRNVEKTLSTAIMQTREDLIKAVEDCRSSVNICHKSVRSIRTLTLVVGVLTLCVIAAVFPLAKMAWIKFLQ